MSFQRKSIYACNPSTTRGQAVVLSADPKNSKMLYTNGRTVIIRDLVNPTISTEYTEHSAQATCARWSPSGYYIASGDAQGNVRIWDTVNEEHILKIQSRPITGRVNDIAWDSESKRLIAVGDGKERFGHAFAFDTANSCGDIIGHNKIVNTCAIRNVRPFRAATAGDDMIVNFYHGPPFKFAKSISDHTRFVQCIRFSPDGKFLTTVGSDGKIFIYDGSTGDKVGEILDGHSGGIYSVSWSPDSTQFMTSSADMTVKFWDVNTKTATNTVTFSGTVDDQQLGNLWAGQHIISLSLSGDYHYLDPRTPKPAKTIFGHQKGITSFTLDTKSHTFFTGSYDGRIYAWDANVGNAEPISGKSHTNQVSSMSQSNGKILSAGMDDVVKSVDISKKVYTNLSVPTEAVPKSIASKGDISVVATVQKIIVLQGDNRVSSLDVSFQPSAIAISNNGQEVAVGSEDFKVRLYSLSGTALTEKKLILDSNRGIITALAYSPDGKYLAVADSDRKVFVYDTETHELKFNEWVFHSSRVTCVAWSPDSLHAASGGLDRDVYVWSTVKPMKSVAIKGAHQDGVSGVGFLDNNTVISTGHDACVKIWNITHH